MIKDYKNETRSTLNQENDKQMRNEAKPVPKKLTVFFFHENFSSRVTTKTVRLRENLNVVLRICEVSECYESILRIKSIFLTKKYFAEPQ